MSTFDPQTGPPGQVAMPPQQYAIPAQPGPYQGGYVQPMPPAPVGYAAPVGPVGKVRSTWAVIGLSITTLGIYSLYYNFATFDEMKRHTGEGVGGVIGLVLALFTGSLVTAFLFPNEVGNLYARQGRPRPVTAVTGLWLLLGWVILVGPIVWLVKTNGALNAYWRSVGAR